MSKQYKTAILTIMALATAWGAPGQRAVTAEDYDAFKNVTDARLSPDGKQVAYVVTSADAKKNRRESQIWVVPRDGSRPAQPLTTGTSSRSPRWSPNGQSIAFLSARPDKPQVHGPP